jgi:uncharacterized Zn finger protein/superfamily II DNA or RNA helicase
MVRKTYGKTWWGKAWLNALTAIDYNNRLPRGRRYANEGAVTKIEIKGGEMLARVQGRRRTPYQVTIRLTPFLDGELEKLDQVIGHNFMLAAELAVGRLPESLPALLGQEGISLFPESWRQVKAVCSCPDWANPCKHLAAVFYVLANEIDKDPFILFELRGHKREDLLSVTVFDGEETQENLLTPLADVLLEEKNTDDFSLEGLAGRKNEAAALFTLLTDTPMFPGGGAFKVTLHRAYLQLAGYVDEEMTVTADNAIASDAVVRLQWELDEFTHPLEQVDAFLLGAGPELLAGETVSKYIPVAKEQELEMQVRQGKAVSLKYLLWSFLQAPLVLDGSAEVNFLSAAASVALALVRTSLFVPEVVMGTEGKFYVRYRARTEDPDVRAIVEHLASMLPAGLIYHGEQEATILGRQGAEAIISLYLACLVQDFDDLHVWDELSWVFFGTDVYTPKKFEERQTGRVVADWLAPLSVSAGRFVPVVRVELPVGKQKKFRVYLDVEDRSDPLSPLTTLATLFETDAVFGRPVGDILAQVAKHVAVAGGYCPELQELLSRKGTPLLMGGEVLVRFISDGQSVLRMLGMQVLMPKELRSVVASKLVLSAKTSQRAVSYLSLNEMLSFSWEVALDDIRISQEDFLELAAGAEGVVRYRDRYLLLDPAEVNRLLAQLRRPAPKLSTAQVLRAGLTGETEDAVFEADEVLQTLLSELTTVREVTEPRELVATLRPYQERGFRWLYGNWGRGLGCCLADDMGLGKTLQVITLILKLKEEQQLRMPVLVVCPTSLLGNWEKECARFAPTLRVAVCHGPDRQLQTDEVDVILTTYGVVRNDSVVFAQVCWGLLVIDEAQNIKNADSGQAQALKELQADGFVAMSGTPVENRLDELWSIFDFLMPGFLGTRQGFSRSFAIPIEKYRDRDRVATLRKATSPFVLRRMKTDKTVITDLPDKVVKNEFCRLTVDQAALYRQVLDREMAEISGKGGMARRGLILRLMTSLKQICNHPVHYSRKGLLAPEHSGKAELALSLLKQIVADGEKALVFSQYKEMGALLVRMIEAEIGLSVPFFHGSLQRKKREQLVDEFQEKDGCPLMVVSLKAGGTGLNLTEASHVLHYDLWWNPAVEDQATDRAYRIGQKKNVTVHRFITIGSLEEKIDAMLASKKELADMTVTAGETWLTEMSDSQLREIFSFHGA